MATDRIYVVRYVVPVYAYVNLDQGTVEKVAISREEMRLDYDRINHEHYPEVVMDPETMDIPGPLEDIYRHGSETDSDEAWTDAERIVALAENKEWPTWTDL